MTLGHANVAIRRAAAIPDRLTIIVRLPLRAALAARSCSFAFIMPWRLGGREAANIFRDR
jgi:hypothetical protein